MVGHTANGEEQEIGLGTPGLTVGQIFAYKGEWTRTISSGITANTSYYLPLAEDGTEGDDWFDVSTWNHKTFLVYADQQVEVDIYASESLYNVTGPATFYPVAVGPSQQLQILAANFQAGMWNSIQFTLNLGVVQMKVVTGVTPPTTIMMTCRTSAF